MSKVGVDEVILLIWIEQSKIRTRKNSVFRHFLRSVLYGTDKVFKNGPSKICVRQPLKNFTWSILEYFVPYDLSVLQYSTYHFLQKPIDLRNLKLADLF